MQRDMPQQLEHNVRPAYRPDIDGLRATAILAVVIYHAFPSLLPGGFVGVDIFFVISGFLISSIIFRSLRHGEFSFAEFYAHRVKRIFPALILVLASSFAFAWFALFADEFRQFGKHVLAGAGFIQNFVIWGEAGYFDTASELKPLMHLWSLAIEEQFYFIYPLLIWAAWRFGIRLLYVIVPLALLSFGLNVASVGQDTVSSFFGPQSRFWELLAGALLSYFQLFRQGPPGERSSPLALPQAALRPALPRLGRLAEILSIAGLGLIVAALITIDKRREFPGWWALAPVGGAVLLILAGPATRVNRRLLAHPLMIFVGAISYPLYLWHWPILSFARIMEADTPSAAVQLTAVALSILLSWLTYRLLEKPIRFGRQAGAKTAVLSALLALVAAAGFAVYRADGLPSRQVDGLNPLLRSGHLAGERQFVVPGCGLPPAEAAKFGGCQHDERGPRHFALLGDSKAASLAPGIFAASGAHSHWLFIGGNGAHGAPLPVISDEPAYARYQARARSALATIRDNPEIRVVVLTAATRALFQLGNDWSIEDLPANPNFEIARAGLERAVGELVAAGKQVVMTVDNPSFKDPKQCISRITALPWLNRVLDLEVRQKCQIDYDRHLALSHQYRQLLDTVEAKFPGKVHVFDTLGMLCDMTTRRCASVQDGKLLYSYSDHISDYASARIAARLVPFAESLLGDERR